MRCPERSLPTTTTFWLNNHNFSVIMEYVNEGLDHFYVKCLFKQVTAQIWPTSVADFANLGKYVPKAVLEQTSMTCYWPFAIFFWREMNLDIKGTWNNNSMAASWLFQWYAVNRRVYEPDKCAFMQNREKATFALKFNFNCPYSLLMLGELDL